MPSSYLKILRPGTPDNREAFEKQIPYPIWIEYFDHPILQDYEKTLLEQPDTWKDIVENRLNMDVYIELCKAVSNYEIKLKRRYWLCLAYCGAASGYENLLTIAQDILLLPDQDIYELIFELGNMDYIKQHINTHAIQHEKYYDKSFEICCRNGYSELFSLSQNVSTLALKSGFQQASRYGHISILNQFMDYLDASTLNFFIKEYFYLSCINNKHEAMDWMLIKLYTQEPNAKLFNKDTIFQLLNIIEKASKETIEKIIPGVIAFKDLFQINEGIFLPQSIFITACSNDLAVAQYIYELIPLVRNPNFFVVFDNYMPIKRALLKGNIELVDWIYGLMTPVSQHSLILDISNCSFLQLSLKLAYENKNTAIIDWFCSKGCDYKISPATGDSVFTFFGKPKLLPSEMMPHPGMGLS